MKNTLTITLLLIFTSMVHAQNYDQEMTNRIQQIYESKSADELTSLAQQFERIGLSEQNQWLPYYYSSLAYTFILLGDHSLNNDQKDAFLDLAEERLQDIGDLPHDESEVLALQALIYQMRIFTPSRGQKYSMKVNDTITKGLEINKNNPRLYYLLGTNAYHTPKFFGGGAEKSRSYFEHADLLFNRENQSNTLMPNWGHTSTREFLDKINNN